MKASECRFTYLYLYLQVDEGAVEALYDDLDADPDDPNVRPSAVYVHALIALSVWQVEK